MGMTAELAALPDALWEKHRSAFWDDAGRDCEYAVRKEEFLAAIKEAMQAQKKRHAEICREKKATWQKRAAEPASLRDINPDSARIAGIAADQIAAAIEREQLL